MRSRGLFLCRSLVYELGAEADSGVHCECTNLFLRFVDDGEFLFEDESKAVHFRSMPVSNGDFGLTHCRREGIWLQRNGKLSCPCFVGLPFIEACV